MLILAALIDKKISKHHLIPESDNGKPQRYLHRLAVRIEIWFGNINLHLKLYVK